MQVEFLVEASLIATGSTSLFQPDPYPSRKSPDISNSEQIV